MTGEQFDALAKLMRMPAKPSREAARDVLVAGYSLAKAAERHGITYQGVWNSVAACREGVKLAGVVAGL